MRAKTVDEKRKLFVLEYGVVYYLMAPLNSLTKELELLTSALGSQTILG
jgi:hypothetical protein